MSFSFKKFLLFFSGAGGVLLIDQQTKSWVLCLVPDRLSSLTVTPYFNIVHVWNRGVSFGLLKYINTVWVFVGFVCIAVIFFIWCTYKEALYKGVLLYGTITGGALGNITDRLMHGAVFDFLDFHWGTAHFPAFNFADACISTGAVLLALLYRR
ncbi:MAG: signal peptidase II [Holosporales bacterium]|jgi:signal peptidase II|nr:signal peptidase II [Holosporales bacterium]